MMTYWLFNIDSRIRIAIRSREVRQDLESASPRQRAEVLALTLYLRRELLEPAGMDGTTLDNPLVPSREQLIAQFQHVQRIRARLRQNLHRRINQAGPDVAASRGLGFRQIQSTVCALELWTCTIAAGFLPGVRHDVSIAWRLLALAESSYAQAILTVEDSAAFTSRLTGIERKTAFAAADHEDWLAQCRWMSAALGSRRNTKTGRDKNENHFARR